MKSRLHSKKHRMVIQEYFDNHRTDGETKKKYIHRQFSIINYLKIVAGGLLISFW